MDIGKKIQRIREIRGYKQEFMADELGMTVNGYGKIERGENNLTWKKLNQIVIILGFKNIPSFINFDEKYPFLIGDLGVQVQVNRTSKDEEIFELYEKRIQELNNHVQSLKKTIELLEKQFS